MLARVPIRLRLTLWYVFLLALILAAFAAGVYLLLRHALYDNLDSSIRNRASALLNIIQYEGDRPVLPGQALFRDPARGSTLPVGSMPPESRVSTTLRPWVAFL